MCRRGTTAHWFTKNRVCIVKKATTPKVILRLGPVMRGAKYIHFGHGLPGVIIWWTEGRRFRTFISVTGSETHHRLRPKLDMDARWRGRIVRTSVATMLPPIRLYAKSLEPIPPKWLLKRIQSYRPRAILVDTSHGLRPLVSATEMTVVSHKPPAVEQAVHEYHQNYRRYRE